jgi:hypothetical protein
MNSLIERIKEEWDEFLYKYSEERVELARNRLKVHRFNLEGKCEFNPYTQPESPWYKFIDE